MQIFGKEIRWSDPPAEQRGLEQMRLSDIGLAFDLAQADMLGLIDTSIPAFYRSRQFLTDIVASLPLEEVVGHQVLPLADTNPLLLDPHLEMTYHDLMAEAMNCLIDHGNAFPVVTNRGFNGDPVKIHIAPPHEVVVNWADRRRITREYSWLGRPMQINRDIFHIRLNPEPGALLGKGPVQAARDTTLAAAQAEEVIGRSLIEDHYMPGMVIKDPNVSTVEEAERILEVWRASRDRLGGGGRKRPSVVNSKAEIEQIPLSLHDQEWIESRNFTVQQIGRLMGVHGFFLLVESGSSLTYSTTESLFRLTLTSTLRPTYLEPIEQVFSRLLPLGRRARFNANEILRADIVSRYQANNVATGGVGFKTVNEVREEEGLSPIAGGDSLLALSTQPRHMPTAESRSLAALMNGGLSDN